MDHAERIRAAVEAIETSLPDRPDMRRIVETAGLSPWHFQRVFRALVGETVGSYVRKRQLSRSIPALLDTDRRILDIAIEHGFESQEAYSRAFRAVFELPPGRFRKRGQRASGLSVPDPETLRVRGMAHIAHAQPRIVERAALHFVGARGRFVSLLAEEPDAAGPVGALWQRFERGHAAIEGRVGADGYGLCVPIPPREDGPEYELEYLAAAQVAGGQEPPAGFSSHTSPPSLYAVFEHRGGLDTLHATIATALFRWLPHSGFTHGAAAEFERYAAGQSPARRSSPAEFWLAITPETHP